FCSASFLPSTRRVASRGLSALFDELAIANCTALASAEVDLSGVVSTPRLGKPGRERLNDGDVTCPVDGVCAAPTLLPCFDPPATVSSPAEAEPSSFW